MEKRKILVVSPHADDSEFGMGGTIIKHIESGDDVHISLVLAVKADFLHLNGNYVSGGARVEEFAKVIDAYRSYGEITYDIWLTDESNNYGFQVDGHLDMIPLYDLVNYFDGLLSEYQPNILYFPGRSVHQDHRQVFEAMMTSCRATCQFLPDEIYLYELPTYCWNTPERAFMPNTFVVIDPEKKMQVVLAHTSQQRPEDISLHHNALIKWNEKRGIETQAKYAEAFMLLRRKIK